jgi:lipopolysaccharide transport system ATP-binding protein
VINSATNTAVSYAIDIVALSKRFKRHTLLKSGYTTIKSSFLSGLWKGLFRRGGQGHFTHAVEDLTIRVPRGASLGIIGRNGSGKSTLLKLITGIYRPTTGSIAVNGRIAALIELGAGFHPDFTGRENLYLGGVMHGLSREQITQRFDEIVRFAELESVIDDPVRTYSSGMFMRLGFSLAVHTDPDILLIDEVLAVGDATFVSKCKERIARLRKEGKTLLLVTHDLDAVVRWCDEALWLHKGEVKDRGEPRRVIDAYREFVEHGEESELAQEQCKKVTGSLEPAEIAAEQELEALRWGSREVEICGVRMLDQSGEPRLLYHSDAAMTIEIGYQVNDPVLAAGGRTVFGIGINRSDGLVVFGTNTAIEGVKLPELGKSGSVAFEIPRLGLLEGNYSLDIAVHREDGYPYDYHKGAVKFAVRSPLKQLGVCVPQHIWRVEVAKGAKS